MDIEKARQLLWPNYDYLSDEQIGEIVSLIRAICRQSIKNVCKKDKCEKS